MIARLNYKIMYDDNFGDWHDCNEPEVQDFYRQTQRTNVKKICVDCGKTVSIQPQYECCNSCAEKRENGS